MRNPAFAYAKTKAQISCTETGQLISAFVFARDSTVPLQDLFHVYLNKCEIQFLRLHIDKTNTFCFLIDNGRVTGTTK